jgi:hypothetical protein
MCKNIADPDRPQRTIWRMRIACCIPEATNTVFAFAGASVLIYMHVACLFLYKGQNCVDYDGKY